MAEPNALAAIIAAAAKICDFISPPFNPFGKLTRRAQNKCALGATVDRITRRYGQSVGWRLCRWRPTEKPPALITLKIGGSRRIRFRPATGARSRPFCRRENGYAICATGQFPAP